MVSKVDEEASGLEGVPLVAVMTVLSKFVKCTRPEFMAYLAGEWGLWLDNHYPLMLISLATG